MEKTAKEIVQSVWPNARANRHVGGFQIYTPGKARTLSGVQVYFDTEEAAWQSAALHESFKQTEFTDADDDAHMDAMEVSQTGLSYVQDSALHESVAQSETKPADLLPAQPWQPKPHMVGHPIGEKAQPEPERGTLDAERAEKWLRSKNFVVLQGVFDWDFTPRVMAEIMHDYSLSCLAPSPLPVREQTEDLLRQIEDLKETVNELAGGSAQGLLAYGKHIKRKLAAIAGEKEG